MLNSIQRYFLKKQLKAFKSSERDDYSSTKIAVLFNEKVSDKNQLLELIEKNFDVNISEINHLGYSERSFKGEKQPDSIFTKKDFNLFGQPKSEVIHEFLNHKYKLLFNFFGNNQSYLEHIAHHTQAKLKVGLSESNENINDLLLALNPKDLVFFEESSKYIKHII